MSGPSRNCKLLTIFEGCDGTGKTTEAKRYAEATGARYVHFPALKQVTGAALARMYIEAMMPALLGYQDVVFDRSWLSEIPYGTVFRQGADRLKVGNQVRLLERLAMRCGAIVVFCDPGWEAVEKSFLTGREEMLKDTGQLKQVHELYGSVETHLPEVHFDYLTDKHGVSPGKLIELRTPCHLVGYNTAGNLNSNYVVLIDGGLFERTDLDAFGICTPCHLSDKNLQYCASRMDKESKHELMHLWVDVNSPPSYLAECLADKQILWANEAAEQFAKQNNLQGTWL